MSATPPPAASTTPTTAPTAPPASQIIPASAWGLLLVLAAIWGTSFILMKKGLAVFSPLELGATRVSVASLLLLPFALRHIGQTEPSRFKWLLLSGVVGTLLPAFLFAYAETRLASGLAGVLNALTAVFTLLVGAVLFGQRLTGLRVLGIALGLLGTIILMLLGGSGGTTPTGISNAWYGLYIVLATIGYGISVNVIKQHLHQPSPVAVTSLTLLTVGPLALLYLFGFSDFTHKLATTPATAWPALGYIALLATMSTAVAMVLFNKLIRQSTTLFAASNTYLIPIVALGWGLLDGEAFNSWHLLGMAVILLGVFIIHRAK